MSARRRPEPLRGFSVQIPVRFAECDSYGVVWHGHYALYLEQAREALTARFGFTATRALSMGYRVPVTRMEIRYRVPIFADSFILVTARLRPPDVARFLLDYEIRSESGELLAEASTEQVVVKASGELLVTLPGGLRRMAEAIVEFQKGLDKTP
ncbi:MAG TPA: acyl-CoA thioesterase [Thermoanaerobaculia bacterium]|nr:acyl-CoA thioesterase [Thermoanaerobaculia bacterium]